MYKMFVWVNMQCMLSVMHLFYCIECNRMDYSMWPTIVQSSVEDMITVGVVYYILLNITCYHVSYNTVFMQSWLSKRSVWRGGLMLVCDVQQWIVFLSGWRYCMGECFSLKQVFNKIANLNIQLLIVITWPSENVSFSCIKFYIQFVSFLCDFSCLYRVTSMKAFCHN